MSMILETKGLTMRFGGLVAVSVVAPLFRLGWEWW